MRTEQRGANVYNIHSTRDVTALPWFEYKKNMYNSLQRPYDSSKPGNEMWKIMQKDWFRSIANEVYQLSYSYLLWHDPNDPSTMKILHIFQRSMIILPKCIKVFGTTISYIYINITQSTMAKTWKFI